MNEYKYRFATKCPNNGSDIWYTLRLWSATTVMVEKIIESCRIDTSYHEDIADLLHAEFGGRQIITAVHDSVKIKTKRGF